MIRDDLKQLLAEAVEAAMQAGDLPRVAVPEITLDHPPKAELGDYASPLSLKMARSVGKPPLEVAGAITAHLRPGRSLAVVETAPPGFVNFHLAAEWLQEQVDAILAAGPAFGRPALGAGRSVQVEFVSANPTGPLHVGAARNAALGDVPLLAQQLHRLLEEAAVEQVLLVVEAVELDPHRAQIAADPV